MLLLLTIALSVLMLLVELLTVTISNHDLTIALPGILPGMFLGAFAGFILENKFVNFTDKPAKAFFYVTRLVLGGIIVSLCFVIPHFSFGLFSGVYIDILRHFTEFTLIGLGIALFGPYVFTKFESYWLRRS